MAKAIIGFICLSTACLTYSVPIRRCYLPCREIEVRSDEVRDVYVTACHLQKVTIIGDPSAVQIHASKPQDILCEPFHVIDVGQSTQRGEVNKRTSTSTTGTSRITTEPEVTRTSTSTTGTSRSTTEPEVTSKEVTSKNTQKKIHPKLPGRSQGSTNEEDIYATNEEDIYEHDEVIGFLSWAASVTAAVIIVCFKRYLLRRRRCGCAWNRSNNNAGSGGQEDTTARGEHCPMFPHTPPSQATTPSSASDSTLQPGSGEHCPMFPHTPPSQATTPSSASDSTLQPGSANMSEITFTTCSSKPLLRPSSSSPELVNTHTAKRVLFKSPPITQQESDAQRDLPVIQPIATSQSKILDTSSTSCAQTPLVDLPVSANTRSKTAKKILDTSSTSCAQTPLVDLPVSANTRSKTAKKS
nr:flocculation protein FLO11-like [Crassostrea gigas]